MLLGGDLARVALARVTVRDVGGDGVGALSSADAPVNTTLADCDIEGVGHLFLNQPAGVRVRGAAAGSTVTLEHNAVRDSSYAGIMLSWQAGTPRPAAPFPWRFVARGNLVEDCGNGILSDFGGIYVSTSGEACQGTDSCFIPTLIEGK